MSIPLDKDLLCMLDIARSCVGSLVCQPGDQYEGEDGRSRSKSALLCCKRFQGPVKKISIGCITVKASIFYPTQRNAHINLFWQTDVFIICIKNREITYLFGLLQKIFFIKIHLEFENVYLIYGVK